MAKFKVIVESQKGTCGAGHKTGDEIVVGPGLPMNVCGFAYHCMFPNMRVLSFDGNIPHEKEPGTFRIACPDPDNPVVFKVVRLKDE